MTEDLQHPVVLICGGPAPDEEAIKYIPIPSTLIAVDSGLDHARSLQLKPDLLIGDLDSISTSGLQWASQQEIKVKEFPSDKNKSDFELALDYARGVSNRLLAIGSDSGRVDQLFGMIASLASAAPHFDSCHALIGKTYCTFTTGEANIHRKNGAIVSVFAMGGIADGVSLRGFRWELAEATLLPGSSLGLSNELNGDIGKISVRKGTLVVIQPDSI
ncbi:MAG TPA: thiamine diphosphokinase [Acidimicrobiaceae bacterium]|jgi:thiamine pyrophosphokinase|nr:thiamine diphosphokinase [Acidimicrobiaceae bacterium]